MFLIKTYLILIVTSVTLSVSGAIIINQNFEGDPSGWSFSTIGEFSDGINDYSTRTDGSTEASGIPSYINYGGSYFWALEDTDTTSNPDSPLTSLTWTGIDFTSYNQLDFSILIGAGSTTAFDLTNDYLVIQYQLDGSGWIDALRFENDGTTSNTYLAEDTDFDGIGDGTILGLNLQHFTTQVTHLNGTLLDVRIEAIMVNGDEAVGFDDFNVIAVPEPAIATLFLGLSSGLLLVRKRILRRTNTV